MIIGIGTDVVQIERIENIFNKYKGHFLSKVFHSLEIQKFNQLSPKSGINYLAKRFAGKEAVSKALGTGFAGGLEFKDIAIVNNDNGMPEVFISPDKISDIHKYKIHISLSDDYPVAVAFVMISM